jgi:hypothetical protein
VDAVLGPQIAVCVRSLDQQGRALDARLLPRLFVHQFDLETTPLGPPEIEPLEHLCPVLALGTTGPGVDLDECVGSVVLAGHLGCELDPVEEWRDPLERRAELGIGTVLALAGHLHQHLQLLVRFNQRLGG